MSIDREVLVAERLDGDAEDVLLSCATDRQIWIAGGMGVAPFLSWLRAIDGQLPQSVDFFYSATGEPPFAQELRAIADAHPH